MMDSDLPVWQKWASFLQHKGLDGLAASWIEAAGPLNLVLAQLVYFGQPFMGRLMPLGQWEVLGRMLEDRESSRSFVTFLRKEDPR